MERQMMSMTLVRQVLIPERFVQSEATIVFGDHVLHAHLACAAHGCLRAELGPDRVLPAESRQEEIDRARQPQDEQEQSDTLDQVVSPHSRPHASGGGDPAATGVSTTL